MQVRRGIQFGDEREQFRLGSFLRQNVRFGNDAQFGAGFFLAPDIDLRRGILAHAHEREAGNHALPFQFRDAHREFALDLRGDGAAVNEVRGHGAQGFFADGALVERT